MKFQLRWGNDEKTIIVIDMQSGWDWQDFYAIHPAYKVMLDSVEHEVHLIYLPQAGAVALPPNAIYHMRQLMQTTTHVREGLNILVGHLPVLASILKIMKNMYGVRHLVDKYHLVPDLETAYAVLANYEAMQRRKEHRTA